MITFKSIKNNYLSYFPLLLIICLYFPQFKLHYMSSWANLDYHHAYFILPVSLWLSWRQCKLHKFSIKPSSIYENITGLILLTFGAFQSLFLNLLYSPSPAPPKINKAELMGSGALVPGGVGGLQFPFPLPVQILFQFP